MKKCRYIFHINQIRYYMYSSKIIRQYFRYGLYINYNQTYCYIIRNIIYSGLENMKMILNRSQLTRFQF